MILKDIRKRTGLTQKGFAEYFQIPVRTIEKWERGGSNPPEYLYKMIVRILDLEDRLNGKSV